MMRRFVPLAAGVVLILVGIGLYVVSRPEASDYGWFAYTPLNEDLPTFASSGQLVFLTQGRVLGALVIGVGLLVVTAAVAYWLGRRRADA
jgi:multisubunit Na+/H+ antiporter MnhC subunit